MYNRDKDLILVCFFGFIYYAIVIGLNGHLTQLPLGEYYLIPFILSTLMGISISRPSQMIEWPLCFLFGGTVGCLNIILILSLLGMHFSFHDVVYTISQTLAWFGAVAVMITIGILIGTFSRTTYNIVLGSLKIQ